MFRISDLSEENSGITCVPSLSGRLRAQIVALGDVGMTMLLGLRLLGGDVFSEIGIFDVNRPNLERLEMEVNQIRYPADEHVLPEVKVLQEDELFDCDVFIFCASKGVPPVGAKGDMRMVQLEANRGIISHYAGLAKERGYRGLVCVVSDPVDPLCKAFLMTSGLDPGQVRGYGLGVMNARARYFAERDARFRSYLTEGRAFGPHGQSLVIANSLENYDDTVSRELTELVVTANHRVRDLGYKPYLAPAMSSAAISILLTIRGEWHYSSIWFGDRKEGAFLGLYNRLTEAGPKWEDTPLPKALYERIRESYQELRELT